jgi:plastocyanin
MRRVTIIFAALAVTAVLAVPAFAATTTVNWKIGTVNTVNIKKGNTVKWNWSGRHNVVGPSLNKSTSGASRTFSAKGTFVYICTIHGATVQKTTVKVS